MTSVHRTEVIFNFKARCMVEPFFRKPRTPQELQLRAQAIQARLEGLSIDELMRGGRAGEPPHLGVGDPHGRGYDPNQPRVSAGHPDGGQWTSKGGDTTERARFAETPRSLGEVISDSVDGVIPGARYAAAARRSSRGPIFINGRPVQITVEQASRLAEAEVHARDAVRRVQEIEPNWRPRRSAYETAEGMIRAYQAEAREANARYTELTYLTGPGRFAAEWIPSTSTGRLHRGEQREINMIGRVRGCHTCGRLDPGTRSGNHIGDHQQPTALNQLGRPQRRYPQCLHCSNVQGGKVRALMKKRGR